MRKLFTLLIALLLVGTITHGQSNYGFSYSAGTYTEITGGTLLGNTATDDERFVDPAVPLGSTGTLTGPGFPIGFNFTLADEVFDRLAINANGWISLGKSSLTPSVNINSTSGYTPIGSTTVITPDVLVTRIAGLGRDLQGQTGSSLRIETIGTAPNRVCVIQWKGYRKYNATGDDFNFQIRLLEGSNNIEVVYGTMTNNATSTTVQVGLRGVPSNLATNFHNRLTTTDWTSTTKGTLNTDACTLSNTVFPASGTTFTFTPPPPCAVPGTQPTDLVLTPALNSIGGVFTAAASVDNYLVVRSTSPTLSGTPVNGTVYTVGQALGGGVVDYYGTGTTFTTPTNLPISTTFYFFVFSANHATCAGGPLYLTTGPLTGTAATLSPGNIVSAGSGSWGDAATWVGGVVPTASDNATILSGHTVTVNAATNTCYNLLIQSGGEVNATGTVNRLTVNNNLTNNGTLDLYNAGGTAYCDLTFTGAYNSTFTGSGSVTDLHTITINKGSGTVTIASPTLEIMPDNLTIKNVSSSTASTGGFLNTGTFNGIVKFSGTYTLTNTIFLTAGYSIPATGGVWFNNNNLTVAGMNGSPTLLGLFRISRGIFNLGTSSGNSMGFSTGSKIYVEGGTINAAGRFGVGTSSNTITYSQSGGDIVVCTVGNTSTTLASFDLGTSATSSHSLTGGTVTVQLANTATSGPRDVRGGSTSVIWPDYTGTTIYLGNASSGASKTFYLGGCIPPMVITTTSATHKAALAAAAYYFGDLSIPSTSDFNLNGFGFWCKGDVVNNGTITGTLTGSRFDFAGALLLSTKPQSYSGSGTMGASATPILSTGFNNSYGITLNNTVYSLRANMFLGTLNNSSNLTFGNGTSGAVVAQMGVQATAPGGNFDNYPVMNLGSGTYTVLYTTESVPRVTSYEIPVTRNVTSISVNNTNGVTLAGGNLTLGATGTFTLVDGIFNTSAGNVLILTNPGAAVTLTAPSGGSATSHVNGPMERTFAASRTATGTYTTSTLFPVGKGGSYMPLWVDPTTDAGSVTFRGEAFVTNSGTPGPGVGTLSGNRWEAYVTAGKPDLTSSYVRFGDGTIAPSNQIWQAPSGNGIYRAITPATAYAAGTPNTLTTATQIPAAEYDGYFAYGETSSPFLQAVPATLNCGFGPVGGYSSEQTYVLSGDNLAGFPGNIAVTAPANFEVSLTAGSGFGPSLNVPFASATLAPVTIYVRCAPTAPNTGYSGDVTNIGGGASINVAVTGNSYLYTSYCVSAASSTADEDIGNVTLGTLNNTSTCASTGDAGSILNRYSNYTLSVPAPVLQRTVGYPFSVSMITCGGNYGNGVVIFIDFNQDGDFDDAGEKVYFSPAMTTGPHTESGTITIPAGASLGLTMMRVIGRETGTPSLWTACETYSWGETEDYLVEITEAPACPAPGNFQVSAGTPATSQAILSWVENGSATQWDIEYGIAPYAQGGGGTSISGVTTNPYTINGLNANETYQFHIRADCGGTYSPWIGPVSHTTECDAATSLTENFDAVTVPALPACWKKVGAEGSASTQSTGSSSSPNCLYIYAGSGTYGATVTMPPLSNLGAGTHKLTFKLRANFTIGGVVQVGYMTNPTDPASFVLLQSFTTTSTTVYQDCEVIPGTVPGANQILAFRQPPTPGYSALIDDVVWAELPTSPILNVVPGTLAFGYIPSGGTSPEQLYTLSGQFLDPPAGDVTITPPANFEVSLTSGSGYSSAPITVPYSGGTLGATPVYVIFKPTAPNTPYAGDISNTGGSAPGVNVAVNGTSQITYCAAGATSTSYEKISNVQFNTINNPSSSTAGYEDFTAISTTVYQSVSYPFEVIATPNYTTDQVIIWIDYNQNGSFTDAGEQVYISTPGGPYTGSITIPASAPTGTTRMRIRLHDTDYGSNSTPCGNSEYGQVEDYSINILSAVTFQVNMSQQTVSPLGVHIAGSFQGWIPGATPLTDMGGGVWAVTIPLAAGSYEYKFINGNAWGQDESVPGACSVNGNRGVTVTTTETLPLVCFGLCTDCPPQIPEITFQVNMSQQTVSPLGVHIAGSFQGWDPGATPLTDMGGGVWAVTMPLAAGSYEYKFINGNAWGQDESIPGACNVNGNRGVTVTTTETLPLVCFGSCTNCVQQIPLTLSVDMANQTVSPLGVHVAGSFQGWNPGSTLLAQVGVTTVYEVTVMVDENSTHQYKFINGNDWPQAEIVPDACGVPDGFGGYNRNITVGTVAYSAPVVCFGECAACVPASFNLDVTVFLEGPFSVGDLMMSTDINANGDLPLAQPYNVAPWNYAGTESVAVMPANVVDWVLVDLRDADDPANADQTTSLTGWPKAFFLNNMGQIVALDGSSLPDIGNPAINDDLYIVVRHRSHIDVMSATGAVLTGNAYTYDFRTALTQAYGAGLGFKSIGGGVFGMVSGDVDADGSVFTSDFSAWAGQFGNTGVYVPADMDMDGQVFTSDFSKWAGNFGIDNLIEGAQPGAPVYSSQVPERK